MRWKIKNHEPLVGDTRTRIAFTWFPTIVYQEVVWLEKIKITERWIQDPDIHVMRWVEIFRETINP